MSARRFPRSPEITPKPFDGGPNPFADDVPTPIPHSDNPLAAPVSDEVQPYKPTDYVLTQSDRSNRVLVGGLLGAGFVAVSSLIAIIVVASTWTLSTELVYCFPANLVGLSLCIPAWIMGSNDLRAIHAGVMDDSGRRRTRIGYWCGWLGTLIGVLPFLAVVLALVLSLFS